MDYLEREESHRYLMVLVDLLQDLVLRSLLTLSIEFYLDLVNDSVLLNRPLEGLDQAATALLGWRRTLGSSRRVFCKKENPILAG